MEYLRFLSRLPIGEYTRCAGGIKNGTIENNPAAELMDAAQLPFPYPDIDQQRGRILSSSRFAAVPSVAATACVLGCRQGALSCALELTFQRLQRFLDARVQQVKFVDRTFNCSKEPHQWQSGAILPGDNGVTNFRTG